MSNQLITKDIWRHFTNYLYVLWKFLGLPEPTDRQYEMAELLQQGSPRLIIEGYRGIGKSWITAAFCSWVLGKDQERKFMNISGGEDKAKEFSQFVMKLIETFPLLGHINPPINERKRWSIEAFDIRGANITQAPSVRSKGITGMLTGGRPTDINFDDIETPKNSATPDMRDKLFKLTAEFEALLVPGGRCIGLGTPQSEESIYNRLVKERGYSVVYFPIRTPNNKDIENYGGNLSEGIKKICNQYPEGTLTDPKRFSELEVREREARIGASGFKLQFMLDTTLSDADRYPLKLRDLIVMDVSNEIAPLSLSWGNNQELQLKDLPPVGFTGDRFYKPFFVSKEWTQYEGKILVIDPSGRGKDELGWCIMGQLGGRFFIIDFGGLKGGYEDPNMIKLCELARDNKVHGFVIEDNFGDGMFTKLFKSFLTKIYPMSDECINEWHSTGQKEKRILEALEPVMNSHRLIINYASVLRDCKRAMVENQSDTWYSGMKQLTRLTKDRGACAHDDIIEVFAMGVAYFSESLQRNMEGNIQKHKDKLFDKDLKNWLKNSMSFDAGGNMIAPQSTSRGRKSLLPGVLTSL